MGAHKMSARVKYYYNFNIVGDNDEPFVHGALFSSMTPVGGCFPFDHGGSVESIELRAGGMIMEECPTTAANTVVNIFNILCRLF